MVLYTGGTIGMQASANGLAPASGFEARMRDYLPANRTGGAAMALSGNVAADRQRQHDPGLLAATAQRWSMRWTARLRQRADPAWHRHPGLQRCGHELSVARPAGPGVFTGSMLPAGVPDSDAWENLSGALARLAKVWRRACTCTSMASCWRRPVARKCAASVRHPFKRLKRQGGGMKATSIPAALNYNQPKQLANVAVLPLFPGIGAGIVDGCSTAVSKVWCWSATAAAPGRATIPSSSPAWPRAG
jgi:L-asparaginase